MHRTIFKDLDWTIIVLTLIIFILGLFILYSASLQKSQILNINFLARQIIWMIAAIFLAIFLIRIDYHKLLLSSYFLFGINLLFLILVLLIGPARLGARRWLSLGLFNIQPSEIAKFTFILALTNYLANTSAQRKRSTDLIIPFIFTFITSVLILFQPDLGTALLIIMILFVMLFIWGMNKKILLFLLGIGVLSSPFAWNMLRDYQKNRLLIFINPQADPLGAGYTIIQSKIAIGSGGIFGKGWLSGTQSQLNFLPERHTDFIFSVVGEEWGFVGAVIFIVLFLLLVKKILFIALSTNDISAKLLCSGIAAMIAIQVFINIAMTMGIIPVVGMALPLVSYGGSSLITTVFCIALVLNINIRERGL